MPLAAFLARDPPDDCIARIAASWRSGQVCCKQSYTCSKLNWTKQKSASRLVSLCVRSSKRRLRRAYTACQALVGGVEHTLVAMQRSPLSFLVVRVQKHTRSYSHAHAHANALLMECLYRIVAAVKVHWRTLRSPSQRPSMRLVLRSSK